jgi:hypothetical protein
MRATDSACASHIRDREVFKDLVSAAGPLGRVALPILLAFVAWWSVRTGIVHVMPIGDFHGPGRAVRATGILTGALGGLAIWTAAKKRYSMASAIVLTVATTSAFAAIPGQLDQGVDLIRQYSDMPSARAERSGAYQIPSVPGDVSGFDALSRALPPDARYVLYSDWQYKLWAHSWLLPRLAVASPATADWAIFHGTDWHQSGGHLRDVRRVDGRTWIGRLP